MAALIADNVDPREMGVAAGMNTVVADDRRGRRRPGRRGAPDRADDRRDVDPGRVGLHDHVRTQRGAALVAAAIALSIGARPLRRLEPADAR